MRRGCLGHNGGMCYCVLSCTSLFCRPAVDALLHDSPQQHKHRRFRLERELDALGLDAGTNRDVNTWDRCRTWETNLHGLADLVQPAQVPHLLHIVKIANKTRSKQNVPLENKMITVFRKKGASFQVVMFRFWNKQRSSVSRWRRSPLHDEGFLLSEGDCFS